jgi:hypothetical protein
MGNENKSKNENMKELPRNTTAPREYMSGRWVRRSGDIYQSGALQDSSNAAETSYGDNQARNLRSPK